MDRIMPPRPVGVTPKRTASEWSWRPTHCPHRPAFETRSAIYGVKPLSLSGTIFLIANFPDMDFPQRVLP
jgi:hypothetical protein